MHLATYRLRLPDTRHIPGSGTKPELDYLHAISNRIPKTRSPSSWRGNLPYRYGWFLFLNRHYWESHEVWESVWLKTPANSRERFLLQTLIQLANAGLKLEQGKLKAAKRILAMVATLFVGAFPPASHPRQPILGVAPHALIDIISNMRNNAAK